MATDPYRPPVGAKSPNDTQFIPQGCEEFPARCKELS